MDQNSKGTPADDHVARSYLAQVFGCRICGDEAWFDEQHCGSPRCARWIMVLDDTEGERPS